MTEQRLAAMAGPLLDWYDTHKRTLPWRGTGDPYQVWVSEIMLQQTRVAAVLGYYARFLAALPTVEALAGAGEDQLMKLWEGLGYYSRARNLQKAAKLIVEQGGFPDTYDGLLQLPGVGDYTASAIASASFGRREAAVDGNVLRVVTRLRRKGVAVPDEMAVVSFDNSQYSELAPVRITSLSHGEQNLGELAATLLLRTLQEEQCQSQVVPWVLVEKESG